MIIYNPNKLYKNKNQFQRKKTELFYKNKNKVKMLQKQMNQNKLNKKQMKKI